MQLIKSIALVAVAVAGVNAQTPGPMINTPASIVQCQPVQLTFSAGTPPYFISILPGGQLSAPALEDLGQHTGTSLTWNADIAQGTSITLQIRDSNGASGQSAMVTIQPSGDSSCIGKNSQSSSAPGSTSAGSSVSSASGSTTSAASTSSGSTTSAAATSQSSAPASASSPPSVPTSTKPATTGPSSSSPAASSPAPSNAASSLTPVSAVGILGALLAVVIA